MSGLQPANEAAGSHHRGFVATSDEQEARRANRRRLWEAHRAQNSIGRSLFHSDLPEDRAVARTLKSLSLCRRHPRGELVTVRRRGDRAHFGDLQTCNSPWCVNCGTKIAEVRALEYAAAAVRVVEQGGLIGFSTWTFSHGPDDDLSELLKLLSGAQKFSDNHRRVREAREGVRWHDVRRLDATHGPLNGYHPHRHRITFFRPGTTREQAQEVDRIEFELYRDWMADHGREASYAKGHDFQVMDTTAAAEHVVIYLCKDALRELTYTHTKWGRGENRSIAQVLADFYRDGLAGDRDVYCEWAQAMKGKKAIRPSPGLRRELLPDAPDLTDAQVAELDDGLGLILDSLTRGEWSTVWGSKAGPAALLDAAELVMQAGSFDVDQFRAVAGDLLGEGVQPGSSGRGAAEAERAGEQPAGDRARRAGAGRPPQRDPHGRNRPEALADPPPRGGP